MHTSPGSLRRRAPRASKGCRASLAAAGMGPAARSSPHTPSTAWGNGQHGELGDGSTAVSDVPVAVAAAFEHSKLSGVASLSTNDQFR
jgi:hypothetical protein